MPQNRLKRTLQQSAAPGYAGEGSEADDERGGGVAGMLMDAVADAGDIFEDGDPNAFEMLRGYADEDGVLHKEFEVRDITGRDTENVWKTENRKNASRAITTLLSRCVTRIGPYTQAQMGIGAWTELIRKLYTGDQDWMLVKLREYSLGSKIETSHVCPNEDCKAKITTELELCELEILPFTEASRKIRLAKGFKDRKDVTHRDATIRLPNGCDREILTPVARQNPTKADTLMLTRCMSFDDGYPVDDDLASSLTVRDRKMATEALRQMRFGVSMDFEIACEECGAVFTATLNPINFL
jgi:hypothetical protein